MKNPLKFFRMIGDPGGARTHDPLIKSQTGITESTECTRTETHGGAWCARNRLSFAQGFAQMGLSLFRVKEGATFRPSHLASLRMGEILPICGFGDSFTYRVGGGAL